MFLRVLARNVRWCVDRYKEATDVLYRPIAFETGNLQMKALVITSKNCCFVDLKRQSPSAFPKAPLSVNEFQVAKANYESIILRYEALTELLKRRCTNSLQH